MKPAPVTSTCTEVSSYGASLPPLGSSEGRAAEALEESRAGRAEELAFDEFRDPRHRRFES